MLDLEALTDDLNAIRNRLTTVTGYQRLTESQRAAVEAVRVRAQIALDRIAAAQQPDPAPDPEPEPTPDPEPTPEPTPGPATAILFKPASAPWNAPLPAGVGIHAKSADYVRAIMSRLKPNAGGTGGYDAWFQYEAWSSRLTVVADAPLGKAGLVSSKTWTRLHQRLQAGVPMPANLVISSGADAHVAVYDTARDVYWELWGARRNGTTLTAEWGGVIDRASQNVGIIEPVNGELWGATATSLPVAAGVVYADELAAGVIPHALAFAIPGDICSPNAVWPAKRSDGYGGPIPQGTRFKLPADVAVPAGPPILRMLTIAARDYGLVLRDQAGAVQLYGDIGMNIRPYDGGQQIWDWMPRFPWTRLQAVA